MKLLTCAASRSTCLKPAVNCGQSIKAAAKQGDFENYIGVSSLEGRVELLSLHLNVIFEFMVIFLSSYNQFMVECLQPRTSH